MSSCVLFCNKKQNIKLPCEVDLTDIDLTLLMPPDQPGAKSMGVGRWLIRFVTSTFLPSSFHYQRQFIRG